MRRITSVFLRRYWLASCTAAMVLVMAGFAIHRWQSAPAHSAIAKANVPLMGRAAITIAHGIHMLGGLYPSAAYIVDTGDGLVLIDSGLESDASRLKAQMADLGLDWRNIRVILLTHAHGDHTGGADHLRAATGAKVCAGLGDCDVLRTGEPREAIFSTFYMPNIRPHRTTVDVELKGDEVIKMGGFRFRALAAPGHSPGSVCYLAESASCRALFAGDVIMMLAGDDHPHSELRKPLGTYSAYLAPQYRGNAQDFLSSLRKLRELPVPDLLLPGHPNADRSPQRPCLSQERWESLLDGGIHDMENLLARYHDDGANFLDGHPKRLLPELYYLGDFKGGALYGFFASGKFFIVGCLVGPNVADFLESRLAQIGPKPVVPTTILLTSCEPEATAGLAAVIAKYHVEVVTSAQGLAKIRSLCPAGTRLLSVEDLPGKSGFPVSAIPLRGRGQAPVAYQITLAGKSVLFSGRIPIKVNHDEGERLFSDLSKAPDNVNDYLSSLSELHSLSPNLWLPAYPSEGQNANLYDGQWNQLIQDNWSVIEKNINLLNRPVSNPSQASQ